MKTQITLDYELGDKVYIYNPPRRVTDTILNCVISDTVSAVTIIKNESNSTHKELQYRLRNNNYSPTYYLASNLFPSMESALEKYLKVFDKDMEKIIDTSKNISRDITSEIWAKLRENPEVFEQIKLLVKMEGKK